MHSLHCCMHACRQHTLRKRRSRAARHYWRQQLARSALAAWRQRTADARDFRAVVQAVGSELRLGLLSSALGGWRDVLRVKGWQEACMLR